MHTTAYSQGMAGVRTLLVMLVATLPAAASSAATTSGIEALLMDRRFFVAAQQATGLIEQGGLSGAELGRAHLLRGRALFERLRGREAEADFLRAFELIPTEAASSSETAYWLGRMYARGGGDKQRALALLQQAARGGVAEADYEIALLYGDPADNPEGLKAFQRASRKGVLRATVALARVSSAGARRMQNPGEAARLYRLAAQRGDAEAQYQLALAYRDGYGVPKDLAASRSWQDKALAQGHAGAHLVQGNLLDSTGDLRLAQYHYWQAAQGGLPAGVINHGLAYLRGRGVAQDLSQAARWLSRAEGVPMADFYLGGMLLYGLGVERNDQIAFAAFQRAANLMPDAKALLAGLYQNGVGIKRDPEQARRLIEEVLEMKDAGSMRSAAWALATAERTELRAPTLAKLLAERSSQLDSSSDLQILAAAFAAGGEFDQAVQLQQRAVDEAPAESRELPDQRLARYQSRQGWTEPFQPMQARGVARSSQTRPVASFIGEVVQLAQAPAGRRGPGYEIGSDAAFAIRVLIEKIERGTLPHFMQESAILYVHDPAETFAGLRQDVAMLLAVGSPLRFVLSEVEDNGWGYQLDVSALEPTNSAPNSQSPASN